MSGYRAGSSSKFPYVIMILCLLAMVISILMSLRSEPIGYVVVTATPTPTYETFQGNCPSYCPTPCNCLWGGI